MCHTILGNATVTSPLRTFEVFTASLWTIADLKSQQIHNNEK